MPDPRDDRPTTNATGWHSIDWKHLHLWQIQPVRDVLLIGAIFALLYLGYKISIVTVPLMLALLLAYLLEPIVHWLTGSGRIKRSAAAGGLIATVILVIVVPLTIGLVWSAVSAINFAQAASQNGIILAEAVGAPPESQESGDNGQKDQETPAGDHPSAPAPGAEREIAPPSSTGQPAAKAEQPTPKETAQATAYARLPNRAWREAADYLNQINQKVAAGEVLSPTETMVHDATKRLYENKGTLASLVAKRAFQVLVATLRTITTIGFIGFEIFLTAFFFFFISINYRQVLDFGRRLVPESHRPRTVELFVKFDDVIAGFVRGRLTIALIQAVIFSIGYFIIGTPAALLVGFCVGILSIVPYLALIGIPVSMLLMALDPADGIRGAWWWILIAPVVWYFIGQAIDDYILTPKIQGERTGLDTPTVLFAVLAGGALAGFYGLLIAIPVAACVKILIREVLWPRFNAWVAGRAEDPLPLSRAED